MTAFLRCTHLHKDGRLQWVSRSDIYGEFLRPLEPVMEALDPSRVKAIDFGDEMKAMRRALIGH